MKTLKTLGLLLFVATGIFAQPTANDMFISGYVTDQNGNAQANHEVCVSFLSNNPSLPSDTICANTNANGYYSIVVVNGSLTGPNVSFDVSSLDSCAQDPLVQSVDNQQGTVDSADVDFVICSGGCDVEILYSHPPSGAYLTANATGTAPFQYEWNTGDTSETVFVPSFPGVYCVQVTDATGCQTGWVCDTVDCSLGVSPTPQITRIWQTVAGSIRLYVTTGSVYEEYAWFDGGTSYETVIQNPNPSGEIVCVTVTDDYGCVESVCDTIELPEYNCPPIDITTTVDTAGGGLEYSLEASGGFESYEWWPTDDTSQAIVVQNVNPNGEEYCVIGGGPSGCYSYSCDTLFPYFNGGCVADLWYEANVDSNLIVIDTLEVLYAGTQSSSNSYFWTIEAGGQVWTANTQDLQLPLPPTLVPTAGIDVEVCVTVADSLTNCVDSYCEIITLVPDSNIICDGSITTTQDSTGLYYTLSATGFGVGPFSFDWSNGATSQEITVAQSGVYCVDVTNASGCVYTVCDTIGGSSGCDASFTSSGLTPNGYTFTADVQDSTLSYQWLLDGTAFSGGYDANLQNLANGVYTVCLTVNDSVNNCFDTQCFTFASGCDATFATAGPTPSGIYTLTADHDFNGWDYAWTVNNLVVSTVSELETSLPTGVNEVCLTITDSLNNCTDTQCETIISGCDAAFTSSGPDSTGQYSFNADIQNPAWDYLWTSNNQPISSVSIMQTSLPNGVNEVCLTVVDSVSNCSDTQCQTITAGQCNASFTNFGIDSITGEYAFSADVQSPDWNYLWTANNLVVSSVSILEIPLSMGINEICLTVTDSVNNCSETECQTVTVNNNSCYGYISGEIYAGSNNQPLNNGVVYLITYDTATNMLDAVHTIDLGPGNSYQFGPLPCGDYMVKAAASQSSPYYSDHIPTYHGNSPFWSFAQTLSLGQVNTQISADVVLIAANNPGGPGFIGGDVTQGANKVDPGDPLEGMQVMLFDLNGSAIAYTYTDENGEFGFGNLAYGTYQVYVEVLGIPTVPAYVTIGPDNPSEDDIHIYATYELVTTGIEEFDFDGAISEVYPNPVGNDASINFNLESAVQVDIHILDLTGRTISTTSHSISSGESQVRFNVDGLTDGYYFLNVQEEDGAFSVTRKFMRVD